MARTIEKLGPWNPLSRVQSVRLDGGAVMHIVAASQAEADAQIARLAAQSPAAPAAPAEQEG